MIPFDGRDFITSMGKVWECQQVAKTDAKLDANSVGSQVFPTEMNEILGAD